MDQLVPNLRELLRDIGGDEEAERPFTWPATGAVTTIKAAVHSLGSCGLITKGGDTLRLTGEARVFLDGGDTDYLAAVLHANVRFVGEMLREIGSGRSHAELNAAAETSYGLKWGTLDQVRRRSNWFRALGLAELWNHSNQVVLTDRGRSLSTAIRPAQTNEIPGFTDLHQKTPEQKPAGPLVLAETEGLDQNALVHRKPQWGYLAGGGSLDNFRILTDLASPRTTKDDYIRQCAEQFTVKETSAEQTLWTLRALNILEQVGMHTFAPTPVAVEWLDSGNPLDLVRILHCKVALVGEVLSALREESETGAILRWLSLRFPAHRLSRGELTRRLAILNDAELIERIGHTRYRITPLGELFHDALPCLEPAESHLSPPRGSEETRPSEASAAEMVNQVQEVLDAAVDSANPRRFEEAVATSFRLLGLNVEQHGGPGKTDLVVVFWISPTRRCRVTVEVKTDSAGVVRENDIKFDALEEHRKIHKAEGVIVVGPDFGGRLPQWAKSKNIPLISAGNIAEWISRSRHARLFPQELFDIIFSESADSVLTSVTRSLEAIGQVSSALWESGNDENDIEFSGGALTVRDIWRMSKGTEKNPLSPREIEDALSLLSNPLLAASARTKGGEFTSTAPPQLVAARLRTFADVLEDGLPLLAGSSVADRHGTSPEQEEAVARNPDRATPDASPERVRRWAKANGRPVSSKGRLPNSLVAEYLAVVDGN
ncbi:restriction endonuclease [Streptomyces sp. NPDC058464]|uniref:Lsr2 family DNA-binding protein n=1 Tax=Streptomyces sp. NPDC058464 TaxID=3346511 RepID=UPI00364A4368